MKVPHLKFDPGQRVKLLYGDDLEGLVVGVCFRVQEGLSYEVQWIHNGEVKSGWFIEEALSAAKDSKIVGFHKKGK